jgi:hypothetical protein
MIKLKFKKTILDFINDRLLYQKFTFKKKKRTWIINSNV